MKGHPRQLSPPCPMPNGPSAARYHILARGFTVPRIKDLSTSTQITRILQCSGLRTHCLHEPSEATFTDIHCPQHLVGLMLGLGCIHPCAGWKSSAMCYSSLLSACQGRQGAMPTPPSPRTLSQQEALVNYELGQYLQAENLALLSNEASAFHFPSINFLLCKMGITISSPPTSEACGYKNHTNMRHYQNK